MKTIRKGIAVALIFSFMLISCTDDTSHTPVGVDTVPPKLDNAQPKMDTANVIDSTVIRNDDKHTK